eukprot:SAG31_NODE_1946_length_6844_cov_5.947665_8_plen_70_part_00
MRTWEIRREKPHRKIEKSNSAYRVLVTLQLLNYCSLDEPRRLQEFVACIVVPFSWIAPYIIRYGQLVLN